MSYYLKDKDSNRLSFPTRKVGSGSNYIEVYIIPDSEKAAVLEKLYPFEGVPELNDEMVDLHTDKRFIVKDFMVVREGIMDCLVSPYYLEGGGSVIDWIPVEDYESEDEDDDFDDDYINPKFLDD